MEYKAHANYWSKLVLDAALTVHRELGPGLLESAYEACLCHELTLRDIPHDRQVSLPIQYKGLQLETGYRLDMVIADLIVVELKSVAALEPIHEAQLLTCLKLSKRWVGLLINFNVPLLKTGVKRLVNG